MSRPNIVFIYTDQQRGDAFGAAGNPQILTPNLDALAGRGTRWSNHFVQNPLCMPSRISMLTGQYPSTLGITHMGVPVPEGTPTLATHLSRVGYHCANIGKLHFLPHANRDHRAPHPSYDFDHLQISEEPGVYEDAYWSWLQERSSDVPAEPTTPLPPARGTWNTLMGIGGEGEHPGRDDYAEITAFELADDLTHSAFVADQTIEYLTARRHGEPFFCIAGFFSPHAPYIVPQRFIDLYDHTLVPPEAATCGDIDRCRTATHGYYAAISEVDHHVGRIVRTLDDLGLADDTMVVFTSDHGDWLGNNGRYAKGYPGDDPVSRVPLVITGPNVDEGVVIDQITEAIDVVPTLLQACAVPVPRDLQGRSLSQAGPNECAALAVTEGSGWKSIRTDKYRLLVHDDGATRLWDVATGLEVSNDPTTVAALTAQLLTRLLASERPLARTYPY